ALVPPISTELRQGLAGLGQRVLLRMRERLHREGSRLDGLIKRLRHPGERLQQQAQRIDDLEQRLLRGIDRRLCAGQERLARLDTRLAAQHPGRTLAMLRQRLEHLSGRMPRAMQETLKSRRQHLQGLAQTLNIVSPLATLSRGYSILLDDRGQAIRRAD